jgi:hypothetical protein
MASGLAMLQKMPWYRSGNHPELRQWLLHANLSRMC